MTNEERTTPDILNARRRQRIARGSGSTVTEVNDLITRFNEMRKMMKQMPRMQKMLARTKGKSLFNRA
jgi:signal recognition particle subunit SRP54